MSGPDTADQRAEQRAISQKNEFDLRTKVLEQRLQQAESMLRAAKNEPPDVRDRVIKRREEAVSDVRLELTRHLGQTLIPAIQDGTEWLD